MADNKPVRKPSFVVSKSLDTNFKGSLFDKLFPARKTLFEKFPSSNKGLAISGPGIKLGSEGNFSFVSNEKTDKVEYKGKEGVNFSARFKRDAKLFDVSLVSKCSCYPQFNYLVKYEERKAASPSYVVGLDWKHGPFQKTFKINPVTTKMKCSSLYTADCKVDCKNKVAAAIDAKLFLNNIKAFDQIAYNVGFRYDHHNLGSACAAYNHLGNVTLTYLKKIDKLTAGIEFSHNVSSNPNNGPTMPLVLSSIYQIDKETALKVKMNKDLQLNLAVKKEFNSNLVVTAGTALNLQGNLFQAPSFGFKVALKP